jgi:hypothetical protein
MILLAMAPEPSRQQAGTRWPEGLVLRQKLLTQGSGETPGF